MDPEACLYAAEAAINDRDKSAATYHLTDYRNWVANDGFEPEDMIPRYMVPSVLLAGDAFYSFAIRFFTNTFGHAPF